MIAWAALILALLLNCGLYLATAILGAIAWTLWPSRGEPMTRLTTVSRAIAAMLAIVSIALLGTSVTGSAVIVTFVVN